MSLITLQSKNNDSPSDFTNHFTDGILIKKSTTLELVSLVVKNSKSFTITSANDTFMYRIGNPRNYTLHKIMIPNGAYDENDFADKITLLLNDSMWLGIYKNQFKCNYDSSANNNHGGFDFALAQAATPAAPTANSFAEYGPTKPNGDSHVNIAEPTGAIPHSTFVKFVKGLGSGNAKSDLCAAVVGTNGIFCNGGGIQMICTPSVAKNVIGFTRNRMVDPETYGDDPIVTPDGRMRLYSGGATTGNPFIDFYAMVGPNGAHAYLEVGGLVARSSTFPGSNWYTSKNDFFKENLSDVFSGTSSSPWVAGHKVKIGVEVSGNNKILVTASHCAVSSDVFSAVVNIVLPTMPYIKEHWYPLRPVYMGASGSAETNGAYLHGVFDSYGPPTAVNTVVSDAIQSQLDEVVSTVPNTVDHHSAGIQNYAEHLLHGVHPILGATLYQPRTYYFGPQQDGQFEGEGGAIPDVYKLTGPKNVNNMYDVLGVGTIVHKEKDKPYGFQSTGELNFEVNVPNLYVELPDFNIRSYHGATADLGKCIAAVPREELASRANEGILSYSASYPRPIKLNVDNDLHLYQIRARIRNADGTINESLLSPTSIVLYVTEPDARLDRVLQKLDGQHANRQDAKIGMPNHFPRV